MVNMASLIALAQLRKTHFIKAALLFATLCSALLSSISLAQVPIIEVDRTEVARGETVTLTIRVFKQRNSVQIDLTSLLDDSEVLSNRTSAQTRIINGRADSWTDYIVTLFPLREGVMVIPSLTIDDTITQAIEIQVTNQGPRSNQDGQELFLEIQVNKESVFVQEQLLFTISLYYTISGIRNPQFTELELSDSVVQLIGSPNQYEKLIDGVRYGVYEKRYVIFPQSSGPLEIPDILFRGEVTDGSSNFVFRNLNTRRVTAFIEGVTIDIKERPANMRSERFWLPATSISLQETWSRDTQNMGIGESVVRTLTLVAEGLDGAVLPPFSDTQIDKLNLYAEPVDIQRTFNEGSIVGTRIESTTYVPTESGIIEIPAISIPWWNTDSDEFMITTIDATTLQVATAVGELPAEQTVASSGELNLSVLAAPELDQQMIDEQSQTETIEIDIDWLNYIIALALLLLLYTLYRVFLHQHRALIGAGIRAQATVITDKFNPLHNFNAAFIDLRKACASEDVLRIKASLIVWAAHYYAPVKINSMEDILSLQGNSPLGDLCLALQASLYKEEEEEEEAGPQQRGDKAFDAAQLLNLVSQLSKQQQQISKQQRQTAPYRLPPLYKN